MPIPILGDIITQIGGIVSKVVPDADKKMDIALEFAKLADLADQRETQLIEGQIDINKTEAASGNIFVAGWRPFIGWTGGVALGWTWIVAPLLQWTLSLFHQKVGMPALNANEIYPIIMAMLGLGTMRTVEKVTGVASGQLGSPASSQQQPTASPVQSPSNNHSSVLNPSTWFK
jgi:hypothetical protein